MGNTIISFILVLATKIYCLIIHSDVEELEISLVNSVLYFLIRINYCCYKTVRANQVNSYYSFFDVTVKYDKNIFVDNILIEKYLFVLRIQCHTFFIKYINKKIWNYFKNVFLNVFKALYFSNRYNTNSCMYG